MFFFQKNCFFPLKKTRLKKTCFLPIPNRDLTRLPTCRAVWILLRIPWNFQTVQVWCLYIYGHMVLKLLKIRYINDKCLIALALPGNSSTLNSPSLQNLCHPRMRFPGCSKGKFSTFKLFSG